MELSIITLNYKTKEQTLTCIEHVYNQYKDEFKKNLIEHIIIDNDSQDGSYDFLKKEVSKKKLINVRVLENNENVGFGRGNNFGSIYAKGKYLLFLNSDTQVDKPGFIAMTHYLDEHPEVAILGGRTVFPNGKSQLSAWKFYTVWNAFLMIIGFERLGLLNERATEPKQVDWVTGACLMVKKEIFDKIGKFDKNMFMYMEDMELCFRAKKAGYSTHYYPYVEVKHMSQGSSNRGFAIVNIYKNLLYFYQKYMPSWQVILVKLLLQTKAIFLILYGKLTKNQYFIQTYEKALAVLR